MASGWNGSGGASTPQKPKVTAKKPSPIRGIAAGLVVVAAVIGCYFAFFSSSEKPLVEKAEKERGRIKEVTPAAAPTNRLPKAYALQKRYPKLKIPDDWDKPYPPDAYRADGSLKRHSRYVTVVTNHVPKSMLSLEERVFDNTAERDIAITLNTEPGDTFVGDYTYGKKFVKDFLDSLKDPVKFDEKDTEEERILKEAVLEAKKELKARYDAGEDIAAIMNETRQQFQELGLYREEVKQMVRQAVKDSNGTFTEQDRMDLVKAANMMLEERGCKPLKLPRTFVEKNIKDVATENAHNAQPVQNNQQTEEN